MIAAAIAQQNLRVVHDLARELLIGHQQQGLAADADNPAKLGARDGVVVRHCGTGTSFLKPTYCLKSSVHLRLAC